MKCLHSHIRLLALMEGVNVLSGGARELMSDKKIVHIIILKCIIRFQHSDDLIHEGITIKPTCL